MDTPKITTHVNGTITARAHQGDTHLTITAGPGTTPDMLDAANTALRPLLAATNTDGQGQT